ncbi:MAG TPA: alpha-L-fucosidase [Chitinophagaceae bacterium]|nr:alpha-L-fucosidase [Chitinophagaceae bacterium]
MRIKLLFGCLLLLCGLQVLTQPKAKYPVPTKQQLAWHSMEFYWFIHFGPNTFTDKEWGQGDEPADAFDPSQLDCRQWARIAKQSGAKGIIITAKHHDGFCLWPSKYSKHTVRESKWKEGKGDVLKELKEACKEYGLKFGVYLSPWDRNHPQYGTPAYNDVYVNVLKELISSYGPFYEFWWDGANGEGPSGKKQEYDFRRFEQTMRKNAPGTLVFSDIGPDIRWVGNENGIAGETNWNNLDTAGFTRGAGAPPTDTLNKGNINGKNWIPAECDVSIRPGWFYHPEEDEKVKTPEQLFELYLKSVGRGANFLLNVPPDRRGLISEKDSASLIHFNRLREESFGNNLAKDSKAELHMSGGIFRRTNFTDGSEETFEKISDIENERLWVKFDPVKKINCIVLQEAIKFGQRVKSATVVLLNGSTTVKEFNITTIGRKRILTFPAQEISAIRIIINDAKDPPLISEIAAYLIPENLIDR